MPLTDNTISYYVHDSLLAAVTLRCEAINIPYSLAWFCSTCGQVYGRAVVNGGERWDVILNTCEDHRPLHNADNNSVPGSMLYWGRTEKNSASHWWAGVIDFMPRELLEREFLLVMTHREEKSSALTDF